MMTSPSRAIQVAVEILRAYGATRIVLFGSAARWITSCDLQDRVGTSSADRVEFRDLDLACEGLPDARFFEIWGRLLSILPVPVDLVDLRSAKLRPTLRARIAREGITLYDEAD